MKYCIAIFAATAVDAAAIAATPAIGNVQMEQEDSARTTITYELTGAPAIVTVDIQTNAAPSSPEGEWVSIGAENMKGMTGDVHRKVEVTGAGEHRTIVWHPEFYWPGSAVTAGARAVVRAWPTNSPPDWMVIDLREPFTVAWYPDAALIPEGGVTNKIYKDEYLVMRRIPAKGVVWTMGTSASDFTAAGITARTDEPRHKVSLSDDYYIGVYPLTSIQKARVENSEGAAEADYPRRPLTGYKLRDMRGSSNGYAWPVYTNGDFDFEESSKVDSGSWLYKFRNRYSAYGIRADLPTEAQWEYACRAGKGTSLNSGEAFTSANAVKLGRCAENATDADCEGDYTAGRCTVGSYKPNSWGLYDMHGNVMEACLDVYSDFSTLDPTQVQMDPIGAEKPAEGYASRVFRGGFSGSSGAWHRMRAGNRQYNFSDNTTPSSTQGYRLAWTLR